MHPLKPRPLYRSITFWSGLLVMAFLCWGWRDSSSHLSYASFRSYTARNGLGGLAIGGGRPYFKQNLISGRNPYDPTSMMVSLRPDRFPVPHLVIAGTQLKRQNLVAAIQAAPSLRESSRIHLEFIAAGAWELYLPYWCLVLGIALPWSGLLLWRARRHRRAMDGMAASP